MRMVLGFVIGAMLSCGSLLSAWADEPEAKPQLAGPTPSVVDTEKITAADDKIEQRLPCKGVYRKRSLVQMGASPVRSVRQFSAEFKIVSPDGKKVASEPTIIASENRPVQFFSGATVSLQVGKDDECSRLQLGEGWSIKVTVTHATDDTAVVELSIEQYVPKQVDAQTVQIDSRKKHFFKQLEFGKTIETNFVDSQGNAWKIHALVSPLKPMLNAEE